MTTGYLVWWRVADTTMDQDTATGIAEKLGIPAPSRPSPVDVFRKLAGTNFARTRKVVRDRRAANETERLELHPAESQKTMLVRHIVSHVHRKGIPQSHNRVGEAVFYRPPRAQPSKARLRVTMDDPADEWLAEYGGHLREEYQRGLTAFDSQAVRRLVRSYLSSVHALLIDGVYFMREREHVEQLQWLFDQLGGDCRCHYVTATSMEDEHLHKMLADALERAVADGSKLDLLEAYIPLQVVPNRLWQQLEQS